MSTLNKLMEISSRLDHLEYLAEWVARESIHSDGGISQSGTLMCVLCDEVRESIYKLTKELEEEAVEAKDLTFDEDDLETIH